MVASGGSNLFCKKGLRIQKIFTMGALIWKLIILCRIENSTNYKTANRKFDTRLKFAFPLDIPPQAQTRLRHKSFLKILKELFYKKVP